MISGPFTEEFIAERRAMLHDDPQAFRKLWEGEFKVDDERGSGRTSVQLMTLGPDDIYVVGDSREIDYVWHLLHHLRPGLLVKKSNIWPASSLDHHDRLRGSNRNVIVDHAAWKFIDKRRGLVLDEHWSRQDRHK